MTDPHLLLVCTVGGSPPALVASLTHWRPGRVLFVTSRETTHLIEDEILPELAAAGRSLDAGRYDHYELDDVQDFAACVQHLKTITPRIHDWLSRGEDYRLVVDFTGGTKPMSAALALHAHRWRCVFGYVGGERRTKDGVGVVESGSEQVIHRYNPWGALGFLAVEDFVQLFDEGAYWSAARMIDSVLRNINDPARKRELSVLKSLAEAYGEWDRFHHRLARKHLDDVQRGANDLAAVLPSRDVFDRARRTIAAHRDMLARLDSEDLPALVHDLLANARRRADEQRWDDATARLYRAIEATAQCRLREAHGIESTKRIPLAGLPAPLCTEWESRARDGAVMAGLQDAYRLLLELGDPLGSRFVELRLSDPAGSPLSGRNDSILAHGFSPVGEKVYRNLWKCALALAACDEDDLPHFPRLAA